MLQQTRVETVLPYYERFMERFPTVAELAGAEVEEVLALWSGLGYYRRARAMHRAAKQIVADESLPSTLEDLKKLPGVGDYTAAAVGSIAFGLKEPTIDGNVKRVIGRLLALESNLESEKARVYERALELMDGTRPGDSNQAMMELGATICRPRQPRCDICPIEPGCLAAASGTPEAYPPKGKRAESKKVRRVVAFVRRDEQILLFRRPDDSALLSGIWELPWADSDATSIEADLAARYGGRWALGESVAQARHSITTRSFEIDVRLAEVDDSSFLAEGREAGWFGETQIPTLPHNSLVRKVLKKLVEI